MKEKNLLETWKVLFSPALAARPAAGEGEESSWIPEISPFSGLRLQADAAGREKNLLGFWKFLLSPAIATRPAAGEGEESS